MYQILFERLNNRIRYSAWKDCHNLSDYLNGKGDVDLLVDSNEKKKFEQIIYNLGFVKVKSRVLNFDSVEHYYALDKKSGRICHLNIYYKLNTGASHLKAYELPFSELVLKNRFLNEEGVYEANYWVQSIIYTIRHHLKRSSIYGLLLWIREKESYKEEYSYIQRGLSEEESYDKLIEFLDEWDHAFESVNFNHLNLRVNFQEYFLSVKTARSLSTYRSLSSFQVYYLSFKNFLSLLLIRFWKEKKVLVPGQIIAVSGVDGAGKSSMVRELKSWLGDFFNVRSFHVGTPPPTLITIPVRVLIWLRGNIIGRGFKSNGIKNNDRNRPSIIYSLRYLALAYERYRLCQKIQNEALRGSIVITDRYIGKGLLKMDSPRIGTNWAGIVGTIGEIENRLYNKIPKADVLLFLEVSVTEAKRRNRIRHKANKETDEEIEIRHKDNKDLIFHAINYYAIDANKTYKQVLKSLKNEVWNLISTTQSKAEEIADEE